MTGTVSVRIRFVKSTQATGSLSHSMRTVKAPKYVDSERTHLNTCIAGSSSPNLKKIATEIESFCKLQTGRKWQKNSQHFIDGILTFSHDAKASDTFKLDMCAKGALQNIIQEYGLKDDALIYLQRHDDEARRHYHFMLKNQRETGQSARRTFNPMALSKMQTIAGKSFSSLGIKRGKKKVDRIYDGDPYSLILNRSVKQLHQDLPKEIQQKENEIAALKAKQNKIETLLLKAKNDLSQKKEQ